MNYEKQIPGLVPAEWLKPGAVVPVTPEAVDCLLRAVKSALAPSASAPVAMPDWKLVPIESTKAMNAAGYDSYRASIYQGVWINSIYSAMLAAAPTPPAAQVGEKVKPKLAQTQQYKLHAMATNYPDGHRWDKLDAKACLMASYEIAELRKAATQPAAIRSAGLDNRQIAESLAAMVIEWVGEGQWNVPGGWKNGLPRIIEARLDRLAAAEPVSSVGLSKELETELTVFDMGLGFALCHSEFSDTRNAVKKLQSDFTKLRALIRTAAEVLEEAAILCDQHANQYYIEANGGDKSGASDWKQQAAEDLAEAIRALASQDREAS